MDYHRPRGFTFLPLIIKNLLIINGLFYLGMLSSHGILLFCLKYLALHFPGSGWFIPTQLLSYMFLHDPFGIGHLLFNMFALGMFGAMLENLWGPKRFLNYYLATGIGAAVIHMLVQAFQLYVLDSSSLGGGPTLGASGAIYGLLAAYAYTFPNTQVYIYFLFPVKAKYFAMGLIAIDLMLGLTQGGGQGDNVAHFAHLGGALVGFLIIKFSSLRRFRKW
jgi:membrane associated rhomboid family serine protease